MTVVASNFARSPNDLYETEPWATHALLRRFPSVRGREIWEPAAGNHKIADVLRSEGADVRTSDIIVHNRQHDFLADFLGTDDGMHRAAQWDIVTNPPYGTANKNAATFARLALQRTSGWVALLLTAKFDFGKTRRDLFANNPRFAFKIALVDRIQWFPGDIGTEDHAWYVWGPLFQPQPPRLFYEGK